MADYLVQEDGSSKLLLEDGSGAILLETSQPSITPGFISSATVVYAPTVPEVTAPFIASTTALYGPTVALTGDVVVTSAGTYTWLCPPGVTQLHVKVWAGGAAGGTGQHLSLPNTNGAGGGGGGAYAERVSVPVTPGTTYTIVVGAGGASGAQGAAGGNGGQSSFTGDSGVQVIAAGGHGGSDTTKGTGGAAASSTGDSGKVFSGGDGGTGTTTANSGGAGGGASGNAAAAGANGSDSVGGNTAGQAGGAGASGGGSGGNGGSSGHAGADGTGPGGGGGGGAWDTLNFGPGGSGAPGRVELSAVVAPITPSFISSTTTLYAPELTTFLPLGFIPSATVVYTPSVPEVNAPFIASKTHVYRIFSIFNPNWTGVGPGNGGETFPVRLAPNGISETATLVGAITATDVTLELAGAGSFPATAPFVATIDAEVVYLVHAGGSSYSIRKRGLSNTTPASHLAGATVTWGDSYDQAIVAGSDIAHSFTANITGSGPITYPGWLMCFDSSQAYLGGSRYATHVAEVLGVFDAGAGTSGSSRLDAAQPNAIATPSGVTDDCPVGLSNPARIASDITIGDVAVVRYTNPEAVALDLGPRSVALQSWFGMKRVDATDNDVTFTDPTGHVVDTNPGFGPFTGSVDGQWGEPVPLAIGIAPDASDIADAPIPTPNPAPWTTVTLPGSDRYFTYGSPHYNEKGWPIGVLAVRQGNRRVPFWQSWDWHDYSYVWAGFTTDATFAQVVINRNGIVFGSVPTVALPGPQDIDGPDAVWDDATYYMAACWYVTLFAGPYLVAGPTIGGTGGDQLVNAGSTPMPTVGFPGGPGGSPAVNTGGGSVEGGSGGGIVPPVGGVLAWQVAAGPAR